MANATSTPENTASLRAPSPGSYVVPPVDVYEDDKGFVLVADMPGVRPDGLEIHIDRERLTVHGRVPTQTSALRHREFILRDYYRSFAVADVIDTEHINATLKDGILRVELPKAARAQTRRIPIQGA
ncbi:MAG: Hsp20/alpha crystallin family protein [Candidatus Binatia bacterium]